MFRVKSSAPAAASDVAWSCVVDDKPAIWSSIVPWLATAIDLAGIAPSRIHIHHVCALRRDIAELCATLGAHTHRIEPFDPGYPHTNKIGQCATKFGAVRRVILTDADVAFAGPAPITEIEFPVVGKLVDIPNPPLEILREVFAASGLPSPRICTNTFLDSQDEPVEFETFVGNFNGGLYVIEHEHLGPIGRSWARWARWLIPNVHLLGRWAVHVDQVSFCLALGELGIPVGMLDDAWNLPLHQPVDIRGREPFILHHHALFDDDLHLAPASAPRAQGPIERVNRAIEAFRRRRRRTETLCEESRNRPS